MENARAIYVNTLAEGSQATEPQILTEDNVLLAARGWKRGQTVIHVKLLGIEPKMVNGKRSTYLFGDQGVAKVILPVAAEYSGLAQDVDPFTLTNHWVCGVVEDFDFEDEGNRVIIINRVKGLERLRGINAERLRPSERVHAVIQGKVRGAYIVNVGGFSALMPKAWYDWDNEMRDEGTVGEEFPVQVRPTNVKDRIVVSRCHLMENPNAPTSIRVERGTLVKAKVAYIQGGLLKADVAPGFRVSVDPRNMRAIPKVGDQVTVRVLGMRRNGYYGITVG